MSLINYRFHSEVLRMETEVNIVIPEARGEKQKKYPVLYLLHGAGGDCSSWLRYSSIERYAQEKQIAVVMPCAYNSCYADMVNGVPYFTFMSEELPGRIENLLPVTDQAAERFVAGLSMGGRGAFLWALRKPEFFRGAVCLSGSLNVRKMADRMIAENDEKSLKRFRNAFGNLDEMRKEDDVWELTRDLSQKTGEKPDFLYMCGTEDVRYKEQMLPYLDFCKECNLQMEAITGPGVHDFAFWDTAIKQALDWMIARLSQK